MRKKALLIMFVMLSTLILANPVFAATSSTSAPYASASASTPIAGPTKGMTTDSLNSLQFGWSSITDTGEAAVILDGYTTSYYPVDVIGLTFNLQYYNFSQSRWITCGSWSYEGYGTDYFYQAIRVPVSRGFFFRTSTQHYTIDFGMFENGYSTTGGIWST